LVFDTVTTGAANDIEQATRVARAMVTQYGMSERFGLMGLATQESQYLTGRTVLNCGEATAAAIDEEVMMMLKAAYEEAKRLLSENRRAMDLIADFLIEKETITGKEFMEIFHKVQAGEDVEVQAEEVAAEENPAVETEVAAEEQPTVETEVVTEEQPAVETEAVVEESQTEMVTVAEETVETDEQSL
jgi:cell division protease FtsH